MAEQPSFSLYLMTCVALILAPGPGQAFVLARTLSGGRAAGVITAIGLNIGTLFHTVAAALGLSAVLATSALAFAVTKYVGAAYLLYLGVRALLSQDSTYSTATPAAAKPASVLIQAVTAGVLNPKVALFFVAFLPQFVDPAQGHSFTQFFALGLTMAVLDTLYEFALVFGVSRIRTRQLSHGTFARWQTKVSGVVLVALGVRLAAQSQ